MLYLCDSIWEIQVHKGKLEKTAVAVQVETLFEALKNGISLFIKTIGTDTKHAKLVYERAIKKFFGEIPYELF